MKSDGAVMVTGSHNPPDYNGFKMMLAGKPFSVRRSETWAPWRRQATSCRRRRAVSGMWMSHPTTVARLLSDWDGGDRLLRVVWDNGNGAAGDVLTKLVAGLPGEHKVLNAEVDGTFPAHHPDPTVPKNLEQLIAEVAACRADIGIALDGDADRIGLIDNKGRILFGDQLLVILARDVLHEHPGATIIADVKASQVLFDEIGRAGGNPLMWRTGHSLIKAKMAETGSPLAGEMSGHIFFADRWYGFDDALYAGVRLLGVLARIDQKLSDVRDALPQVINTPEVRFDCDDTRKFVVIEEVAARLRRRGCQSVGNRWRTGADQRWLVAIAGIQHPGGAGCARRGNVGGRA